MVRCYFTSKASFPHHISFQNFVHFFLLFWLLCAFLLPPILLLMLSIQQFHDCVNIFVPLWIIVVLLGEQKFLLNSGIHALPISQTGLFLMNLVFLITLYSIRWITLTVKLLEKNLWWLIVRQNIDGNHILSYHCVVGSCVHFSYSLVYLNCLGGERSAFGVPWKVLWEGKNFLISKW